MLDISISICATTIIAMMLVVAVALLLELRDICRQRQQDADEAHFDDDRDPADWWKRGDSPRWLTDSDNDPLADPSPLEGE